MLSRARLILLALNLLSGLSLWASAARDVWGQEAFSFERERVLASYSRVFEKQVSFSIERRRGKVSEVIVFRREAATLRVHFVVHARTTRPTWKLVMYDQSGRVVWTYTPAPGDPAQFWSDEIAGGFARIEVYSEEEATSLRLSIDKIGVSVSPSRPEALTPPDSRVPISTQSPRIRELGRAVARLRFMGDDGKGYYCTGLLLSPELLMTNYHCPQSLDERRSTLVDFDYDTESARPQTVRFKKFLAGDRRLDFAIFRLSAALADRTPLKLDERNVTEGHPLILIQHPEGKPKQVSLLDCRASDLSPDVRARRPSDFGHLCDTLGGSSGSAVLDAGTGTLLGLHHIGFNHESGRPINSAVLLRHIADYLRRQKGNGLKAELGLLTEQTRPRARSSRRR